MPPRQGPNHLDFEPVAEPPALTLASAVDEWLTEFKYSSPNTLSNYEDHVRRLFCGFASGNGITNLDAIKPRDIRYFLAEEAERGIARTSLRNRYASLHAFFNWCIQQDYLTANPATAVTKPKNPQPIEEGFTREEASRLVRYSGPPRGKPTVFKHGGPFTIAVRDRAMVVTLLGTAARADELLSMTLQDVDFANRLIKLHGKGLKDRKIRMGENVAKAMKDWLKVRYLSNDSHFWLGQQRKPANYALLNKMTHALGERAGVDHCTPHRFRHTAATEYFHAHRDLVATQQFLGHSQVGTTMRYLKRLGVNYANDRAYQTPDEWLTA